MEIKRGDHLSLIKEKLSLSPILAILGPRQSGKTTLAKQLDHQYFFDLEDPLDLAKLSNPMIFLENLEGTIIIDEIQQKPELFSILRVLVDRKLRQKYVILGSASTTLVNKASDSLAGRISFHELMGFSLQEIALIDYHKLWLRGCFPLSILAKNDKESWQWRNNYLKTFLERDIPNLGIRIPAHTLRRFWIMLSHYNGQLLNYSELASSFGISDMTVRHYLDILVGTFMIRLLPPWYNNTKKRLIKAPKLYLRDSGIFHFLQNIENYEQLLSNPKLGASFEAFALEELVKQLKLDNENFFFWRTHAGAELDLFWQAKGKNFGVELKFNEVPKISKSMLIAINDLKLEHLWLVYPGKDTFLLDRKITALAIGEMKKISDF